MSSCPAFETISLIDCDHFGDGSLDPLAENFLVSLEQLAEDVIGILEASKASGAPHHTWN
jgi:hypothetical protein